MKRIHNIYFSPAFSTKRVAQAIASGAVGASKTSDESTQLNNTLITEATQQNNTMTVAATQYDITLGVEANVKLTKDDFGIICIPVYAGRVPALAAQYLAKFTGDQTPVAIACVYGNRDYDDALLELYDICTKQGFKVVGAGAFIARHSIFPKLAAGRPDENDLKAAREFGEKCFKEYSETDKPVLEIKGNRPYKEAKRIPLVPTGNRKCKDCGACVKQCPVSAIDSANPKETDKDKCIGCTRCIVVCPNNSRRFRGVIYKLAGNKFMRTYAAPKENEIVYPRN